MSKHISELLKGKIIAYKELNMSCREIAKKTGVSKSSVQRILDRYQETGQTGRKTGTGTSSTVPKAQKDQIIKLLKSKEKFNNKRLTSKVNDEFQKKISRSTVINYQYEIELGMYISCEKPYLRPENVKKRFEMAKTWMFAPDKDWEWVLWSDE
ncbi:hypothetical protein EHP00_1583 [Ecytonucleospora hepatopenaei]|uniref:Transposase Tc1-like domain-containing protein n=1 Tax=Ecytonucleospora hepatopenaei TaxID=646526 RepID=A0A1W0E7T4_9MICR|nr:hypothetical protein EHP00_1583 [Ecytonucleospora hepatopenaei]